MIHTMLKWTIKIIIAFVILLVLITMTGYLYEASKRSAVREMHPAPGEMINLGSHRVHARLIGQGEVTVVMDAGMGEMGSLAYLAVEKQLAQHARVLLYDRAGCNWSEKSPSKRTPEHIAEELHQVIEHFRISGPIILVGHSQGGLNMMKYAAMFRAQVVGLVLIDAAHPDAYAKMPADVKEILMNASGNIELVNVLSKIGLLRLVMPDSAMQLPAAVEGINGDSIAVVLTHFFPQTMNDCIYPEHNDGVIHHGLTMADLKLDPLPVRILCATGSLDGPMGPPPGWNDDLEKSHIQYWTEMQQGLLELSSNSKITVLKEGGHAIPFTQPDSVVSTILKLIEPLKR